MADTLGTTTFLTVISTVTKTPGPVTIKTTFTILIQASGTVTESFMLSPSQTNSLSTSTELIDATTSTLLGVVTITVTPTSIPASTSLAVSPAPTGSAVSNVGISKTTTIILAVFVPLIAIIAIATVWQIRRRGHRQSKPAQNKPSNPLQGWFARASKLWQIENKSVDDLPWQMPDGEGEETKEGHHQLATPPIPRRSPLRPVISHPSRSSRPTSLSRSVGDVMSTGSLGSYNPGLVLEHEYIPPVQNSPRGTGVLSQPSRAGTRVDAPPPTYDGTRRAFYETALNRNLPFDRLARPSLRLHLHQPSDPDRSLTPEPLRLVRSTDSAGAEPNTLNERDGGVRRAYTEPLDPQEYMLQAARSIEQDLMNELRSIDDGPIDEETQARQREATLSYLEGVLPMSPPTSYRASSVYSRDEWGSPTMAQEGSSLATIGQDEIAGTDNRESESKGKDVDRSEDGSRWI